MTLSRASLVAAVSFLLSFGLYSITAFGQCTLSGPVSSWNDGTGNWSDGSDWNGGVPNSSTQSVCITNGTMSAPSVVNLDISASINNLQLGTFDTLNFDPGTTLEVFGTQIINAGQINMNSGGGGNAALELANNVTLSGNGTLTLANTGGGGTAFIYQASADLTLTNQSTIAGAGTIGFNGLSLINQGTVNANASGQTLEFASMTNGINNTGGLLEASNGGTLLFDGIAVGGGGTLTANAGSTVQLIGNTDIVGGTLNNIGGTLGTPNGNAAFLDGSTSAGSITINGTYTNGLGSTTYILGTINNRNNFQLNAGGGANSVLIIDSANVTLQGGGTVTMSYSGMGGGSAIIYQQAAGSTLTNVNNTIEGAGIIGFNGLTVVNEATINANLSGQTLTFDSMTNGLNNTGGTLEASNGGTLYFDGVTVNNTGANITANAGSTVQFVGNTTIQGGTLTNNGSFLGTPNGNQAILDGSTGAGAININGTYTNGVGSNTYILGTINNNNNFQLNAGGGANSALLIDSSNLMLQGGGTVTMSNSGGGGDAIIYQAAGGLTLTNVNNTIEGVGIIGYNGLTVVNEATIDANVSGQTLTLDSMTGGLTNTGMLEASNGGTLYIDAVTVNNAGGGTITANAGSTVQLVGNTTIQGGTLTNNGSFFGTPDGNSAILDGSTAAGAITINGTYTNGNGSDTYLLGTINNNNNFLVTATGNGNNSELLIDSKNVTLQGGGTLTLSTASGGGDALLLQAAGGLTLTNVNNTIQGEGIIGFNGLTLVNEAGGTINANSMGGSLINTLTIESASITNQGLMEATNSGVLNIDAVTINNQGGTIAANGGGATVQLYGDADIQGGTLTNNAGAFFGTPNGNEATLDGSTISGAVTINGTYTNGNNSTTLLLGTINNQGNILLNGGSGNNSNLEIDSATVTLKGGGTVTMSTASGGGNAVILQAAGGSTLENFNNTIQGAGIIGDNGLSLLNDAGGTILANASGQTLTINGGGTVTNNGTFQANSGSALVVGNVTFTNFAAHTLTGGTYNVYGTLANPGTLQINPLGNTGGEIVNNAATILLDGPNSHFVDEASLNALSNFSNNEAAGSFTIQDGRNFTGPNNTNFSNAGIVNIGVGSTFTTGGSGDYNQSGGSTQLAGGTLTAGGGMANFNGGVLFGTGGAINGNVTMAGTIAPAATINGSNMPLSAGALKVIGNYTQTATGIFNLGLGGLSAGTQFGFLAVTGNANLDGTLNVSLINGFFPTAGNTFTFLTTGGSVSNEFATVNGLNIGDGLVLDVIYGSNFVEISTMASTNIDNWLGGTGIWSNGSKWSIGVPTPPDDVFIYSGGNDLVTLNVGSTTINSLAVGGATNGFTSELTDGGVAQTLNITNGLTIGQQGVLDFTGSGSSITAATVTNDGSVTIGKGATLNLTGQPNGVTDVVAGSSWTIGGNFEVGGVANTGFADLASIEGALYLQNGATQTIGNALTIAGGGALDVSNGTTLNINGDVNNAGTVSTGQFGTGSNTLTITGALTNSGTFELLGSKDMSTLGSLTNNGNANSGGFVDVEGGSTLKIIGDVTNNANPPSGMGQNGIYTSFNGTGGNTITIGGMLTNNGYFELLGPGDMGSIGNGVSNAVLINVENGSTLNITGNVLNNGDLITSANGLGMGGSTLNITGNLTNNLSFGWLASGDKGTITGNVSNNGAAAQFFVFNGAMGNVGGTYTNSGFVDVEGGSTLTITGDVTNNAAGPVGMYTSFNGTGGNTLSIGGTLTNNGMVGIESTGDTLTVTGDVTNNSGALIAFTGASMGTFKSNLTNSGTVDLENASTLTIDGNVTNSGDLGTSLFNGTGGNSLTIDGALTNSGTFAITGHLDSAAVDSITNNSGGLVDLEHGSSLSVTGNVTNSGEFDTSDLGQGGGNVVIVNGSFTNNSGGLLQLLAKNDQVTLGSLTNNAGGFVDVENGATLTVNGDVTNNSGGGGKNGIFTTYNTIAGNGGATIDITGMLTNNGTFQLNGPGDMASIGNGVTNSGTVDLENGSTLAITGNTSNSGDFYTDFSGGGGNNAVTITGTLDNAGLIWLKGAGDAATISGAVTNELDAEIFLFGGSKATMNGGLNNAGTVDVEGGSTLHVNGDASNSGNLYTDQQGSGGVNNINITGTLTNSGNFELFGPGDTGTLGGLTNSGTTDVEHGSTLQINGDATNSGDLYTDNSGLGGNNTVNVTGTLDNSGLVWLKGAGDKATVTGMVTNQLDAEIFLFGGSKATMNGGLNNAGTVDVESGSTLQVNGDATNSGNLYTNQQGNGGNNTLNITGMLTNSGTFQLNGPGDMATVGNGVTNNGGGIVNVADGSTLNITGDVTNNGTMATTLYFADVGGNTMSITGNLTNNFDFGFLGAGDKGSISGNVANNGPSAEFIVYGGATGTIGGNVTNSGLLDIELNATLTINGTVDNSGLLATNDLGLGGGSTMTIKGLLTNTATGTITLNGPGDVLSALAGLNNSGVINVNNGSSILPPFFNNIGTLNIDGTSRFVVGTPTPMGGQGYIQTANGTLGEMISMNAFGVINVNGSALLNGTLAVLLQGGFNPVVGSTYTFLNFTPGELSGVFANIENDIFNGGTEMWVVDYNNAGGFVELEAEPNQQPVSEPGTLLVLIPGLLGMGYGLRRRLLK